jgi:DnaJ-class molecular chaperone
MVRKKAALPEVKCQACNGTGFPPAIQPARLGRRIYPPLCKVCGGKGRIMSSAAEQNDTRRNQIAASSSKSNEADK